ncbi:alpha-D-ribose 1-methylphosphonate 5-triphosphate diphosphatase [Nonomuraea sp. NPDC050404]|uniref:alpha-D-ribose 1-methylphosphonate 5-triphosphate diphosphatase n=1 Tax=Nonomuraea sp. NPDC050404 TaxID=3155783 RepID=UPI0033D760E5
MSGTLSLPSQDHLPWTLGPAPESYVLSNVRVVLGDRVSDPASVAVERGVIAEVVERPHPPVGDADGGGLLLMPGLIDVHSDALEKERAPRPSAVLPWDFALASLEGKLVGAGVTTVFHGAAFQTKSGHGVTRTPATALDVCETIDRHQSVQVDHRVLHRFTIRSADGANLLRERLRARAQDAGPLLLSHEDHTPGQGQYADVGHFIDTLVAGGQDRAEATAHVERRMAEAHLTDEVRAANLAWVEELAREGRVRLLGHDPDSAEAIDALAGRGGSVAEFPTTVEAARRAREAGLLIVAGAPNVLRGESHSGNVAATELISHGLVDALASDYLPAGLLGSVAVLVRRGLASLPEAVGLVTAGPAAVAGLGDRGRIAPGLAADFALVDDRTRWPRVVATMKSAR